MADSERPPAPAGKEVDSDQVDFSWLSGWARRMGLIRPPVERPADEPVAPAPTPARRDPVTRRDDDDSDRVDFSWLTERAKSLGLGERARKLGLVRSRPAEPVEQLALFDAPAAPTASTTGPAPRRTPQWRSILGLGSASAPAYPADADDDVLPATAAPDLRARVLVGAAITFYVVLFLYWTFRQHAGMGSQAFDVGIFDQGIWLLSRFKSPFVTVNGRNLFGDHTSFILLPLAVVYWVIPSIKVLFTVQTFALGLGAVPTFLIARDKLRNEMLAALLGVAYLLHPVVGWANLSEGFHPDAFEIPLVLFAFWFALRHRWVGYGICVVALLIVKEDVGLLTFALGVFVALRHDRRIGVVTCAVSAVYMAAAFWLIIPGFLGGGTVYAGRIVFGGPTGLLKKTFTHPGDVVSEVATHERAWYLWQLFAPLGFLAWMAPSILLIAVGPLAVNLFSGFGYQFDVRYHYSTLILPVLVVATIAGVASAPRRNHRALVGAVLGASLVCAYLWSPTPTGRVHPFIADPKSTTVASFHRAEKLIPGDAIVSSYYGYIPQIAHRDEIYMFPNPWKASYWGTFKQEGQRLPLADRVQYVIVPSELGGEAKAVLDDIRPEFETIYDDSGVLLLRKL